MSDPVEEYEEYLGKMVRGSGEEWIAWSLHHEETERRSDSVRKWQKRENWQISEWNEDVASLPTSYAATLIWIRQAWVTFPELVSKNIVWSLGKSVHTLRGRPLYKKDSNSVDWQASFCPSISRRQSLPEWSFLRLSCLEQSYHYLNTVKIWSEEDCQLLGRSIWYHIRGHL